MKDGGAKGFWRDIMARTDEETIMISFERRTKAQKKEVPPLENGDHLDQKTFHERYEATPEKFKAELIEGVVYVMNSPLLPQHGRPHHKLIGWLATYEEATPGVEGLDNTTAILGPSSEP